jgi:hypothetical protein
MRKNAYSETWTDCSKRKKCVIFLFLSKINDIHNFLNQLLPLLWMKPRFRQMISSIVTNIEFGVLGILILRGSSWNPKNECLLRTHAVLCDFCDQITLNGQFYYDVFVLTFFSFIILNLKLEYSFIFEQDDTPPHISVWVRVSKKAKFVGHWIGVDGPIKWSPRHPHPNTLDLFLGEGMLVKGM